MVMLTGGTMTDEFGNLGTKSTESMHFYGIASKREKRHVGSPFSLLDQIDKKYGIL